MPRNIKWGQLLTPEQAAEQVRNSTIPVRDRYRVYPRDGGGGWSVWNHEDGEYETDRDGRKVFDRQEDAHDLAMELAG